MEGGPIGGVFEWDDYGRGRGEGRKGGGEGTGLRRGGATEDNGKCVGKKRILWRVLQDWTLEGFWSSAKGP